MSMQVALKIWRYDAVAGERALKEYEIDAPEEATLLELDIVKDRVDGTLAYRKSCRMMICGSCGMRMDGAAVLACNQDVRARAGGSRSRDLRDGEPPDREGPRRGHGALLGKGSLGLSLARARLGSRREGALRLAGADGRDPQGVALHHVRLLRLRVQLDGGRPGLPRPCGAREGHALRRRSPRPGHRRAAAGVLGRARDLGLHALLLLPGALPEGRRPTGRDRQARCRGHARGDRLRHGRQAREVVRHLREDDRLAAGDRARPQDAGHREVDEGRQVRDGAAQTRQGAFADPAARREARRRGARPLRPRQAAGAQGCGGDRAGREGALAARARGGGEAAERGPYGPGSFPKPYLPGDNGPGDPLG